MVGGKREGKEERVGGKKEMRRRGWEKRENKRG